MGPATVARAALPGSTPAAGAPTTGAAYSDARAGSTSPAPRAPTPRQSGSPPRLNACSPWGSRFRSRFTDCHFGLAEHSREVRAIVQPSEYRVAARGRAPEDHGVSILPRRKNPGIVLSYVVPQELHVSRVKHSEPEDRVALVQDALRDVRRPLRDHE